MRSRKKIQNLNRSDSTGSSSGRKFLAPTLSDPQALRSDKYGQKKKSGNNFMGTGSSANAPGSSGLSTPTGSRSRSQILQPDHIIRSKNQNSRPDTTTESEEYEDTGTFSTVPLTSGTIAKYSLPPLLSDATNSQLHATGSQSMHGFDLQSSSPFDAVVRTSILNNNSSSTGSNIVPSTSKVASNLTGTMDDSL